MLVGGDGVERARLRTVGGVRGRETVLAMFNEKGRLRLTLHTGEEEATLNIFGQYAGDQKVRRGDTVQLLRLGYGPDTAATHRTGLRIFDEDEDERVSVRIVEEGGAVFVTDPEGGYSAIGDEGLTIYGGESDKPLAEYCAPAKEAAAVEQEAIPAPAQPDKTVFRNFIAATADLLACEATPTALHEAIGDAITDVGNKLEAYNEDTNTHARRTLARIFGLPEEEGRKTAAPA